MEEKKEFRIVPFGAFYIVQREVDECYGLFFTKTRKTWKALTIMGHPVFGGFMPATFKNKEKAKEFVEQIKKEDEIEYL